ncbi:hypothetical protein [Desulfobacter sp.]|jgi:hypothetical protein|uniref:hypothetical protein n=1 Tax=Desulfobacter sp. TaxID=2294 RepID=UPI00257B86A1|nr:hypothetical protein [Desulfobacter sp.]
MLDKLAGTLSLIRKYRQLHDPSLTHLPINPGRAIFQAIDNLFILCYTLPQKTVMAGLSVTTQVFLSTHHRKNY